MSLKDALRYPFKQRNLARIVPIGIMYSILIFLSQYFTVAQNNFLWMLSSVAALLFSVALNGFYIRVMRTVRHENDTLPEFDQMQEDFRPGCINVLAILFYTVPVLFVFLFFGLFGLLLVLPLGLAAWATYTVGLTRYAFEFQPKALFDVANNFQIARNNMSSLSELLWRFMAIFALSFGISFVVTGFMSSLFLTDVAASEMPGLGTWLILAVMNVVAYTIGVVFSLSQYHVMTQFGRQLLDDERKTKSKNDFITSGRQY